MNFIRTSLTEIILGRRLHEIETGYRVDWVGSAPGLTAPADTWSFGSGGLGSGELGVNQLYTGTGGASFTAYGFLNSGSAKHLFAKTGSDPNEVGLGIFHDVRGHGEISNKDFINLDFSHLAGMGIFTGTLFIGSVQNDESFNICQGSDHSMLGGACGTTMTGTTNSGPGVTFSVPLFWTASTDVISVKGVNLDSSDISDVLIESFVAGHRVTTPEPASLMLLGTGLVGLGAKLRRRG